MRDKSIIIHIPLYKRRGFLETGADFVGTEHYNDGWLYLRFEFFPWKPWRCGGRDASGRGRVYYKGWHLDCAIGLSIGKTTYSCCHDDC